MVHLRKPAKVFQKEKGKDGPMKEAPSPMMFSQPLFQYDEKLKRAVFKT